MRVQHHKFVTHKAPRTSGQLRPVIRLGNGSKTHARRFVIKGEYLEQLFLENVQRLPNGCWQWVGETNKYGYGHFKLAGRVLLAYRFSYAFFKGEVPDGYELSHICRFNSCVNPDHLEPLTHAENRQWDAQGKPHRYNLRTHCSKGHEFTPENTRWNKTGRTCRTCAHDYQITYRQNQKKQRRAGV
jgi:hypothetical protein